MLELPILTIHLQACSEDWQHMTPTDQGRHCARCNHEVVDFTNSTAIDLEAARAASPDGRLCGRFRQSQLATTPGPQLRPRLRRFLVALVLVCGLGLSGREAWAQVRAGAKHYVAPEQAVTVLGFEVMPEYKDGGEAGLRRFIIQNLRYPTGQRRSGKVFVSFIVTKHGYARSFSILKGMGEPFDTEALRVAKLMGKWIPIKDDVHYTLPITFTAADKSAFPKKDTE
ncbi:energy transducer TonB [Hymenobacter aerilatus]|uniref:Energy transducer TonB n=1 Tax=Hymenobacter aerilatus TaxID=2932251 RepID=A0A8T9SSM4_9BACT|nr:energy transducer TonB [Hymenobacter aerilatus]UOR05138.1 energy transducer TonB [Hymenobacter aerilatus]